MLTKILQDKKGKTYYLHFLERKTEVEIKQLISRRSYTTHDYQRGTQMTLGHLTPHLATSNTASDRHSVKDLIPELLVKGTL